MKRVYIAHPLRGDVEKNMKEATEICRKIAEDDKDVILVSPLHAFSFLDPETCDQRQVMRCCKKLIDSCDEIRFYGEWWKSEGCREEMLYVALKWKYLMRINTEQGVCYISDKDDLISFLLDLCSELGKDKPNSESLVVCGVRHLDDDI